MVRIEHVANEAMLSAPKASSVTLARPSRDALYLTTASTDGDHAVGDEPDRCSASLGS